MARDPLTFRSLLFTPANRPERFARAASSGADGAILDLEDGVGLPHKQEARQAALAFLAAPVVTPARFAWGLRLNHITTVDGLRDLLTLSESQTRPDLIMLPKVEQSAEVEIVVRHLGPIPVVAMIETGRSLATADTIAAHPAVAALAFGGADLAADLGAVLDWESMLFARARIVQAAAVAHHPVFDVPFLDIQDIDGLQRETEAAKRLGYTCKMAIHPAQIAPINAAFAPTAAELDRAQRIVAAFTNAHGGACQLDGRMIDAPVVKAAQRTVQLAASSN